MQLPPRQPLQAGHILVPVGIAAALLPWTSAGVGLWLGALIGLTVGNPYVRHTRTASQRLLAASVVGLGATMDLHAVVRVGLHGLLNTFVGIALCLLLGVALARLLRVSFHAGMLISTGTAICGGSAIAAMASTLKSPDDDMSIALGTVFLLNGIALLLFPWLGHLLVLSPSEFGLWAALAIHDVSSVVGAAMAYSPSSVEIATTVKLARALWILPMVAVVGAALSHFRPPAAPETGSPVRSSRPWFIVGFIAMAAIVTFMPSLRPVGHWIGIGAKRAMVLTLFLVGTGVTRDALRQVGVRPLIQGVVLWVIMAACALGAIRVGLVS